QEEMPSKPVIGHLFKLFDQWPNMQHDMGKAVLEDVMDQVLTPEEKRLFENVLARFQKRQFFSGKGMYQQQAQMTKTEFGKWLQETIQQLKDIEQPKIKGRFQPSLQQTTFVDNVMAKQTKETTRDIESGLPLLTNMRDGTNAQPMPPHYVDHALRQTNQSAPMTKTEQYVMHMQHLG